MRAIAQRAEALKGEIDRWSDERPSSEKREAIVQEAISLHLEAVALSRKIDF